MWPALCAGWPVLGLARTGAGTGDGGGCVGAVPAGVGWVVPTTVVILVCDDWTPCWRRQPREEGCSCGRLGIGSRPQLGCRRAGTGFRLGCSVDLDQLYVRAAGFEPYDFQRRVAEEGLPELLRVPTGCGKTEAVGLGWLYRRRFSVDAEVRAATPRWLVVALPMRTLVEQTADRYRGWLARLGLDGHVGLHIVQGGVGWTDRDWRLSPHHDAVLVGTIDMLLSRALNRGYADRRWHWPISFGGFNNGAHWVFDEIQLMDVATPNTRQLQSFRDTLGTALPTASTWMSATVDDRLLRTVDRPDIESVVELSDHDRESQLGRRLDAVRAIEEIDLPDKKPEQGLAQELIARHQPGTLTLAVVNTGDRACAAWNSLNKLAPDAEVVLLHARFRPADRAAHTRAALAQPGPAGKIVVSTQVLEAGIDLSAALLFTEAAPWPSIVQRAGRCNRDGAQHDARLLWAVPPNDPPYEEADVRASVEALRSFKGQWLTTTRLQNLNVWTSNRITPVIRRKDLIELFDTTPDLSGNDIDVARFIRDGRDRTVQVAWREIADNKPLGGSPRREELCGVPIADFKKRLKDRRAWRLDHLSRGRDPWTRCTASDLRDGIEVVLDASDGGYDSEVGWNLRSGHVSVIAVPMSKSDGVSSPDDDVRVGDDPASLGDAWYPLSRHLVDVERGCLALLETFDPGGLSEEMYRAAAMAGRLHDIGKASSWWQDAALATADEGKLDNLKERGPFAKTGSHKPLRFERRFFRHELASALALMNEGRVCLDDHHETDLVVYLVASHHGRVRLSIRRPPEESSLGGEVTSTLGVAPGDKLPEVNIGELTVPSSNLTMPAGSDRYERRALALRDRPDLGPFRLAFLEMVVRCADWRASRDVGVAS
ncbi:MAG: DEAD/DEAH box helicase [Acidimicrobiaceae bacterium]|nr:DEAD/DEAH box helicase [Acidimicrobiaceae bacterium]MXZ66200.1 DEAD/DEAH box helicase [Acidimicrobiaceae bacterium]MYF32665.1 DEAD/DEAH box helicase [Acidimicrobiaceae bacterium]MYG78169.1 DEAD/DEAH box helicase [Acidimicrobiaceae bacterium]MYJ86026.1 DEAD/DEAH box helicase [Acidimicrobiaceae bacterium]